MNISRAIALTGFFAAVSAAPVWATPERQSLDIAGAICVVLDDIGKTEQQHFPRKFEVEVDEKADLYVVHVIPHEAVRPGTVVMGGGYEVVVNRKTGKIVKRMMGQ